jgi:phosphoribosyl 1,2-cyclic phosphodiesterase
MNFYHTFKYRPELELLTDTEVFDSFVDKSIKQNQKILSDIYIYIENGDIKEAIELFIFNTKY